MEAIWIGDQDRTSTKDSACGIYVAVREITVTVGADWGTRRLITSARGASAL
jgi:hypothetical protein